VGVFLRTYLVHSAYVFFDTRATKDGKIVNPAVHNFIMSRLRKSAHLVHVRRMNEYVHFPDGQMFLATYAGMSIRKKNLSDTLTLRLREMVGNPP